ncbi:MAG: ubiquitin-like domain-containing protein [Jatrophihabitantaceae bacterium]
MLRSFKYGAYAAALAGVVGGTVAFTSAGHDKIVHLLVDGQPRSVQTQASDVSGAIKDAGFTVGAHDLVAPAANSTVTNGETVVYRRGRLLHLSVDGQAKEVWTTAPTVALALTALGYSSEDFTSVSRSRRLPLGATDIALRTPKRVTVSHDGKRSTVTTTDASVAQLLSDLSLRVGPYDRLSAAGTTPLVNGATIALTRVQHRAVVKTTSIPFPTRSIKDASMYAGSTKIVTPGRTGLARVSYAIVFVNGKRVGTVSYHRDVLRTPRTQVQKVGAKSSVPPYTGSPSSAQSIARAMMQRDYGWGDSEFSCLVQMWDRESGWRTDASNPSGAYGIPQALPGSKMSSAGPNWESNATTQIRWGLRYIASRYNTPCQAWGLWQQQGWY